jgi:hypothetical protein
VLVRVRRVGGFAGIEEELVTLNTNSCNAQQSADIEECVAELSRIKAAEEDPGPIGADMLQYEVDVHEEDGSIREIVIIDDGNPDRPSLQCARRLLQALGVAQ